jgi:hypothetical protein
MFRILADFASWKRPGYRFSALVGPVNLIHGISRTDLQKELPDRENKMGSRSPATFSAARVPVHCAETCTGSLIWEILSDIAARSS